MNFLKQLPSVDKILLSKEVKELTLMYAEEQIKFIVRKSIAHYRKVAKKTKQIPTKDELIHHIHDSLQEMNAKKLRKLINATGVIVHTNLGRAPFSNEMLDEVIPVLKGYSNLEFNLDEGSRGSRNAHLSHLLTYLTGAEDVLVVNNNAAALMLILRTFAKDKEVIVSRGELIEIGGSFRLPDIMAASDCKMVEVGTTNKTKIQDYQNAINENTSMLFKAHTSNYVIQGFTHKTKLSELVRLGKKMNLPVYYDMGSGLLRNTSVEAFRNEPEVKKVLETGIDIVSFSGDKLLGGPQAGIIAGKKEFISILKKEPMVRALRVGKTTLAFMEAALSYYLDERLLKKNNSIFRMMSSKPNELQQRAEKLQQKLHGLGVKSSIVKTKAQCGGGALPGETMDSFALKLDGDFSSNKKKSTYAERFYSELMQLKVPVVSILRKGDVYFDVLTIADKQLDLLSKNIQTVYHNLAQL